MTAPRTPMANLFMRIAAKETSVDAFGDSAGALEICSMAKGFRSLIALAVLAGARGHRGRPRRAATVRDRVFSVTRPRAASGCRMDLHELP